MPPPRTFLSATAAALGLSLAITACATRGAPVEAPVELAIAPLHKLDAGSGIMLTADPHLGQCSVRLTATRILKSQPTCYLDEHISKSAGILYYPCNGDGRAEAEFGDQRYTGRVTGGEVEVERVTELDWEDGCHWGTQSVITGTVSSAKGPVLRKLAWKYKDRVLRGVDCSGVCTASTTFDVTATSAKAGARKPTPDDDDGEIDDDDDD